MGSNHTCRPLTSVERKGSKGLVLGKKEDMEDIYVSGPDRDHGRDLGSPHCLWSKPSSSVWVHRLSDKILVVDIEPSKSTIYFSYSQSRRGLVVCRNSRPVDVGLVLVAARDVNNMTAIVEVRYKNLLNRRSVYT